MFYQRGLNRVLWEPRRRSEWHCLEGVRNGFLEDKRGNQSPKWTEVEGGCEGHFRWRENSGPRRQSSEQHGVLLGHEAEWSSMASGASQGVAGMRAGKAGSNRVRKRLMCQANKFRLCHVSKIPCSQLICWEVDILPLMSNPLSCPSSSVGFHILVRGRIRIWKIVL